MERRKGKEERKEHPFPHNDWWWIKTGWSQ